MRTRRTDDGTYPDVEEQRQKMDERAEATRGVTVTESTTTWQHGGLKAIMTTKNVDGKVTRTVKLIDIRPIHTKRGHYWQWEGSFEEFAEMATSFVSLSEEVKKKANEGQVFPPLDNGA